LSPGSLEGALVALENEHEFVLRGGVFTHHAIKTWIDYKREKEAKPMQLRVHLYQFALYYDI
jgi:glutamine synthetase